MLGSRNCRENAGAILTIGHTDVNVCAVGWHVHRWQDLLLGNIHIRAETCRVEVDRSVRLQGPILLLVQNLILVRGVRSRSSTAYREIGDENYALKLDFVVPLAWC